MTEGEKKDERLGAEEKYKALVETAGDGIFTLDLLGRFTFVNPAAERISGYSEEELVGKHFRELLPAKYIPACLNAFQKTLSGQPTPPLEIEMITKQGERVPLELLARPVKREREIVGMIGIARDIIERKQAEEALRKSEERYKKQFEEAMDAIFIADAETGIIVDCNRVASELVGREKSELVGKHQRILHPPEEIEGELSRTFRQHLKEKEGQVLETQVITKKGEIKDVAIKASIFELEGQKMILGIFRDITEQKRAEEALRQAEENFRAVAENANDGILVAVGEGVHVYVNKRAAEITGYSVAELLETDIKGLVHPDEFEKIMERYRKRLAGKPVLTRYETIFIRKDGKSVPVEFTAAKTVWQGEPASVVFFRDITKRKQAEEALAQEQNLLRALMDNVPDYIYFKDRESRFIRTTKAHAKTFGLSDPTEAIGKTDFDFFSDGHARQAYEDEQEVIRTGEPLLNVEEKETWPDRPDTWVLTSKMPLRNAEGNIIGTFGISRDITKRKQAEEALRAEKAIMDAMMDNIPDSIYFKDQQCRLTRINRKMMRDLNLEKMSQAIGKTDVDLFGEEFGRKTLAQDQRVMTTGEPIIGLIESRQLEDGQINWTSTTKVPLRDASGQIVGLVGVTREINELKQAEEEVQKRLREITTLHKVSEVINSTLDLKEVFQRVVKELSTTFGYRLVDIYLLEEEGLRLQANVGYDDKTTIELIPLERGVVGRVARAGQPAFIPDVSQDPDYIPAYPDIENEICVPIMRGDTLLGTLNVESDGTRPLTEDDLQLLLTLSSHIGVAIDNARLYEEEQRLSTQRKTMAEVGRTTAAILEMDALLTQVVDLIAQNFGYYRVHIFQVDQDSGYAVHKAATGVAAAAIAEEGLRLKIGEKGLVGWVAQHGEPVLVNDVSQDPRYYAHPDLPDTRSELDVPIRAGERVIGVLDVQSTELNAFDESDLATLETLAHQLAVAMENARLYQETQRLAITDGLTGLHNLRYFYEALEKEIQRSERYHRSVSLIILDIDDFKAYNDLYGHLAGDDLLIELAQLMSKVTRRTDTLARYGGEEFAIILPETETEGARFLAERLQEEVREYRFQVQDDQTIGQITISLGVATYPHHADSAKALVNAADKALLRAKQAGKNRLSVCGEN